MDVHDESASPAAQIDQVERENARIGYQAAISLATFEGNIIWQRYGSMLLIHTIILSAVGLASNASPSARNVLWLGLSLIGLVLCVVWWIVNDIGFRYFFAWMFSARELEERYLAPVLTVSLAFPVAGEAEPSAMVGGRRLPLRITQHDRRRVVGASRLIIIIFAVLYAAVLTVFVAYLAGH